jgi:hypothetical protein
MEQSREDASTFSIIPPKQFRLSFVLCLFPISCPWQIMPLRQPLQQVTELENQSKKPEGHHQALNQHEGRYYYWSLLCPSDSDSQTPKGSLWTFQTRSPKIPRCIAAGFAFGLLGFLLFGEQRRLNRWLQIILNMSPSRSGDNPRPGDADAIKGRCPLDCAGVAGELRKNNW